MKRISYCNVKDCNTRNHGHGMCLKHYTKWRIYGDPLQGKYCMGVGGDGIAKFWSRVALTADDSRCWEWQGATTLFGYGVVTHNKEKWLTHKFSWFLVHGKRTANFLLHSCDNPKCVNPNHLREGTQKDNVFDMMTRQRNYGQSLIKTDVQNVLDKLANKETAFAIHKTTGIHYHSVRAIRDGHHWSLRLLEER